MTNVMHQVNSLVMGGSNTMIYRLCKYGEEKHFVFSHKDGIMKQWFWDMEIPVYLSSQYDIFKLIEELKIDVFVMHTGSILPSYAVELKERFPNMKFVTVLHTLWGSGDLWVDKIVCVSDAIHKINYPPRSVLIYPGIDRKEEFIIGEVTRLAPYKYLGDLLFIAKCCCTLFPHIKFRIIGEEAEDSVGYMDVLKEKIKKEGLENNVELLGYVDKIDYKDFDAFIHLVGDEAYPVTILEALSNNLPTFTYDKMGTKEMDHGLLFKSNNLFDIANQICSWAMKKPKDCRIVAKQFSEVYK